VLEKLRASFDKAGRKTTLFGSIGDILERVRFAAVIKNNQVTRNLEKIVAMCVFGA
jgi:hypothetical protein